MQDTLELSTEIPGRPQRGAKGAPRVPMLTILAHPDPARVGAWAALPDAGARVSRSEQHFSDGEPLRDRFISRAPLLIHKAGALGLTLSVRETRTPVTVQGTPLAETLTLPWVLIDQGVVITLADRVALWLNRRTAPTEGSDLGILGVSEAAEQMRAQVLKVADLNVPVLILGPSGAGKERVAQALHQASPRAQGPCVAVNMATVPAPLAASELFGHVKGAFSGAGAARAGHFEQAHGGTLFLDEIGDTPLEVQPMMLRTLETAEVMPVGASKPRRVDVRVVAATDADLESAVSGGRFRAPLLHRLAGFRLPVPALEKRREDIGVLSAIFAARARAEVGDPQDWGLPADLVDHLVRRQWPGNVRQLQNTIRQLIILNRGQQTMQWREALEPLARTERAPAIEAQPSGARRVAGTLEASEITTTLEACQWQIKQAAEQLGVSRAALYRRMDKLGISRPDQAK